MSDNNGSTPYGSQYQPGGYPIYPNQDGGYQGCWQNPPNQQNGQWQQQPKKNWFLRHKSLPPSSPQ